MGYKNYRDQSTRSSRATSVIQTSSQKSNCCTDENRKSSKDSYRNMANRNQSERIRLTQLHVPDIYLYLKFNPEIVYATDDAA